MSSYNSAKRLHNFIKFCDKNSHITLANTLCLFYGTNQDNTNELFSTAKLYTDLTSEVETQLFEHNELGEEYRNLLVPILDGCTPVTLLHSTGEFLAKIKGQPRIALHACTSFFEDLETETQISQEVLDKLKEQIIDLEKEIMDSVEDRELREVLCQLIFTAKQSLADYKLIGIVSFKRTFETLLGKLHVEYVQKGDSNNPIFTKCFLLLKTFGEMSGAVNNIQQLASGISPTLKAIGF